VDCCADARGSECHCGACHQTFTGLGLFDAHRTGDWADRHCKPPAALGLLQSARGTWGTPEGLKARERSALTLAQARSGQRPAGKGERQGFDAEGRLVPLAARNITHNAPAGAAATAAPAIPATGGTNGRTDRPDPQEV
jgi:hypothetical protein